MKFIFVIFCFLAVSFSANAQLTLTWTGGGASDNWSDANNWDGVNTPDATHNNLVFDGATRTTPFNDIAGLTLQQIQFGASASSFTVSGNSFTLGGGSVDTIVNNSSFTNQILNNDLVLSSDQNWKGVFGGVSSTRYNGNVNNNGFTITARNGGGGGAIHNIFGNISGTGGFISQDNGSVYLYGNNTYTGPTSAPFGFFNIAGTLTSDVTSTPGGNIVSENGIINGNLSVNGSGLQSIEVDSNSLTVNGNASINGFSHETWALNAFTDDFTSGLPGSQWGQILVNGGNLSYASTNQFDISFFGGVTDPSSGNPFWNSTRRWNVASVAGGSLTYPGVALGNNNWALGYFYLEQQGNVLYLNWQVAPEPSSFALIGLAAIFSSVAITRRKKKLHKDVI